MTKPNVLQPGESFSFSFDLDGESIGGWSCTIYVKEYPNDEPIITRSIEPTNNAWSGFLTSTETTLLPVSQQILTAKLTNTETLEEEEQSIKFYISTKLSEELSSEPEPGQAPEFTQQPVVSTEITEPAGFELTVAAINYISLEWGLVPSGAIAGETGTILALSPTEGTYIYYCDAINGSLRTRSDYAVVVVNPEVQPPILEPPILLTGPQLIFPDGTDGEVYSYDTTGLFSGTVDTYNLESGVESNGITYNTSTGFFEGTATGEATLTGLSISATNADGTSDTSNTDDLKINATVIASQGINIWGLLNTWYPGGVTNPEPPVAGFFDPPDGTIEAPYLYDTSTVFTGGVVAIYALNGTPASWMNFSTTTGALSGTPDAIATTSGLSVTGTNVDGSSTTNTSDITISVASAITGIFVDPILSGNITDGSYSSTNRDNSGAQGNAYTTIQAAINAVVEGSAIYMRGGLYNENILFGGDTVVNGAANNWCSLQSFTNEWAVINGRNLEQYTIGYNRSGDTASQHLAYWKFERFEVTGGCNDSDPVSGGGAGLYISGGPFIVRYCNFHDNFAVSNTAENVCGGLGGYRWQEVLVEYCSFDNNGAEAGNNSGNAAHIYYFSDYDKHYIAENGYTERIKGVKKNEIRYCNFDRAAVAIKNKGAQLHTGRNPGTADYVDDYSDYGNKIHHNFFTNFRRHAVHVEQDFEQVYNNILIDGVEGVALNHTPGLQLYKVLVYNNTFKNMTGGHIVRYGSEYYSFTESQVHHGYDYNNLLDGHLKAYPLWFSAVGINIYNAGTDYTSPDISNYICSNNYIYRPNDADAFKYQDTFYTVAEFKAQTETSAPRVMYTNAYDSDNVAYLGTTGTNQYITDGTHTIETGVTIADGGVNIAHPYLSGVTIPLYIGATNPNDNAWVDGVINDVSSITWLTNQVIGSTPTWVEV